MKRKISSRWVYLAILLIETATFATDFTPLPSDGGSVIGTSYHIHHLAGPPLIRTQPADRVVNAGANLTLRAAVEGAQPLTFQWFKNGQALSAPNSSMLHLETASGADTGDYFLIVTNFAGAATSRVAQITVRDPVILSQPVSFRVNSGETTNLTISAAGTALSFAWKKDGQPIPGATASSLLLSNATPANAGNYQVTVTGTYGTNESAVITLRVNSAFPDPNLNLSLQPTTQWFFLQSAVAHNNDIFLGGLFQHSGTPARKHILKLNSNGSIDPLFAPDLSGGEIGGVSALSLTPDGQLLVGGNFQTVNGQAQPHLARINSDGTLDQQFHPVISGFWGGIYTQVHSIELLPDGRILIGGGFSTVNGQPRPGLALLAANGSLDESFNPAPSHAPGVTWGLVVQPDGKIIAYGGDYRRFHPNGTPDLTFSEAISASSFGNILELPTGQLLINSQGPGIELITTLLDRNGTIDANFSGPATRGSLEALQANGQFITLQLDPLVTNITGNSTSIFPGPYAFHRFDLAGVEDPAFHPWFDNYAFIKASRADGSFLLAGAFTKVAGIPVSNVLRLLNTEPASQSLLYNGTTATWLRSGTSPEVGRTLFEYSSDGLTWTNLGTGTRIPGGWKRDVPQLPSTGKLRARGFSNGSIYDTTTDLSPHITLTHQRHSDTLILHANSSTHPRIILQSSTDLQQWTDIQTSLSSLQFTLTNQPAPRLFYRLRSDRN